MKNRHLAILALLAAGLVTSTVACTPDHEHAANEESESWAVTAWGDQFEIFAETDELVVGTSSIAFTHVTVLDDFSPLTEGEVSVVLRDTAGAEKVFSIDRMTRPGIFSVPVVPETSGEFDLAFRVETAGRTEEIAAGRVRVGEKGGLSGLEGGLVEATPRSARAETAATSGAGAAISFLKEQQWRTEFSTAWLAEGAVRESVRGPGRVEPAAGGEVLLTSPVDGVVFGNTVALSGTWRRARRDRLARYPAGGFGAQSRRARGGRCGSRSRGRCGAPEARAARRAFRAGGHQPSRNRRGAGPGDDTQQSARSRTEGLWRRLARGDGAAPSRPRPLRSVRRLPVGSLGST